MYTVFCYTLCNNYSRKTGVYASGVVVVSGGGGGGEGQYEQTKNHSISSAPWLFRSFSFHFTDSCKHPVYFHFLPLTKTKYLLEECCFPLANLLFGEEKRNWVFSMGLRSRWWWCWFDGILLSGPMFIFGFGKKDREAVRKSGDARI